MNRSETMILFAMAMPDARSGHNSRQLDDFIARMAQGDKEALASFYQATKAAVYGFALSILKDVDNAEDITQDTFLQIYRNAPAYRSQGKPMAWVMTITRNLANSRLREQGRSLPLEDAHLAQLSHNPMVNQDDLLTLDALLSLLDDQERQIVTLHALTGLKHREIAQLLSLPLPTVLSKYHRSIKKLHAAWKEAD